MSQHATAVNVANGIDARHVSYHVVIDLNATTAGFNTSSLKPGRKNCLATYRHEHLLGNYALGLALVVEGYLKHVITGFVDAIDGSLSEDVYTALAHHGLETLGDVLVKRWENLLHELDYCYLNTKAAEHAGKLHTNNATAHDAQALGELLHCQDVVAGHGQFGTRDGEPLGCAARGDDDVAE